MSGRADTPTNNKFGAEDSCQGDRALLLCARRLVRAGFDAERRFVFVREPSTRAAELVEDGSLDFVYLARQDFAEHFFQIERRCIGTATDSHAY